MSLSSADSGPEPTADGAAEGEAQGSRQGSLDDDSKPPPYTDAEASEEHKVRFFWIPWLCKQSSTQLEFVHSLQTYNFSSDQLIFLLLFF